MLLLLKVTSEIKCCSNSFHWVLSYHEQNKPHLWNITRTAYFKLPNDSISRRNRTRWIISRVARSVMIILDRSASTHMMTDLSFRNRHKSGSIWFGNHALYCNSKTKPEKLMADSISRKFRINIQQDSWLLGLRFKSFIATRVYILNLLGHRAEFSYDCLLTLRWIWQLYLYNGYVQDK